MKAEHIFTRITNRIIADIENGASKWNMPWQKLAANGRPKSADGRPYRGLNQFMLMIEAEDNGWTSNTWGTYKTWQNNDCQVRKGEKATPVVLWKKAKPSKKALAADPDAKPFLMARGFNVFAAEQCDGADKYLVPPAELPKAERIDQCEAFFADVAADISYGGDRAFYAPVKDRIQCPTIEQFTDPEHFYTTVAHEHVHWTGHKSRLDRDLSGRFGSESYAMEELVAELGAAFFAAEHGIDQATRQDHSSYLASWLKVLKSDPKALVTTCSKAQQAIDHLNTLAGFTLDQAA